MMGRALAPREAVTGTVGDGLDFACDLPPTANKVAPTVKQAKTRDANRRSTPQ